jgi:hypothetical protein
MVIGGISVIGRNTQGVRLINLELFRASHALKNSIPRHMKKLIKTNFLKPFNC